MTNRIADPGRFLIDTGLLFEINRAVLHPVGLALEVVAEDDGSMRFGGLWDQQDEPGGIVFDEAAFRDGDAKYTAWMVAVGNRRHQVRAGLLGYMQQEACDLPPEEPLDVTDVAEGW